ncbi:MAG TPA: hypothetical protein VG604_05200, partial [Candidatus Saccharimonadales bacterium]|nr:hypothetical protein [Candidatus Saccharimonadales bacterium]
RQTRELYRLIKAGDKVWMSVSYNFDGPKGENGQDAPYADQRITAADVAPTPTHIPHQPQPIHDNLTPLAEY